MIINGVPQKKPVVRHSFQNSKRTASPAPVQQKPQQNLGFAGKPNFAELKEKIISFIRMNGPVIPIQISKAFGGDTMFAGAVLSELIANRILKITNAKIGGSPVYYMPGQEEKLELLRQHLSQKPKQAYDLLKEHLIMRDSQCEPWQRIALRELKDFAMPIPVKHDDGAEEMFWRWHLLSEDDARNRITSIVEGKPLKKIDDITPKPEPIKPMPEPITPLPVEPSLERKSVEKPGEEQKTLETKAEKKKAEKPKKPKKEKIDAFKNELLSTMAAKGLSVFEEVPMKKNEYAFVVKLSSAIGELSYLAIAKNKKKLNEDDVILAYSIGQQHKLPVILFGKEIAAKAEKTISSNAKGIVFLKL